MIHRRADLGQDAGGTGRLAENRDVFRISAELRDVFLHPLDSGTLIQESEIRIWFAVAAFYGLLMQQRVRHKPKCIQTIGHTDHNDAVRGEMCAVEFLFKCAAALIGSAVDPDHDRQLFGGYHAIRTISA